MQNGVGELSPSQRIGNRAVRELGTRKCRVMGLAQGFAFTR